MKRRENNNNRIIVKASALQNFFETSPYTLNRVSGHITSKIIAINQLLNLSHRRNRGGRFTVISHPNNRAQLHELGKMLESGGTNRSASNGSVNDLFFKFVQQGFRL